MLFEGCQKDSRVTISEKICKNCGAMVEMVSTDASVICETCGATVYNDLVDCFWRCPNAKKCLSEKHYQKIQAAKHQIDVEFETSFDENDEW